MATQKQHDLYRKLLAMFGRTEPFRTANAGRDFTRMDPGQAYVHLSALMDALQDWTYSRLPRSAGLPQTAEERTRLRARARFEEAVARRAIPDSEAPTVDNRPSAFDTLAVPYLERNPELREDLSLDYPGLLSAGRP